MKKSCTAVFLGLCLLILIGCSSTPSGTIAVRDIQKDAAKYLGQTVVVVGTAEIKTPLAPKMIRLFNEYDAVYVELSDAVTAPPQGYKIRVTGTLKHGKRNIIGEVDYIEAAKIQME
jgi:hypothetical protein